MLYLLSSSIANFYFQMWVSTRPQRRVSVTERWHSALGSAHTTLQHLVWLKHFSHSSLDTGKTAVHERRGEEHNTFKKKKLLKEKGRGSPTWPSWVWRFWTSVSPFMLVSLILWSLIEILHKICKQWKCIKWDHLPGGRRDMRNCRAKKIGQKRPASALVWCHQALARLNHLLHSLVSVNWG